MKPLKKNEKILVSAVAALVVIFLGVNFLGKISSVGTPPQDLVEEDFSIDQAKLAEMLEEGHIQQYNFLLDPFNKPDKIIEKKEGADKSLIKLEGILTSEKNPLAVINGEVVGIGESVAGFTIEKITSQSVELSKEGAKYILNLEGNNILRERRQ